MEPVGSMQHSQGLSNNSYPESKQPRMGKYLSLKVCRKSFELICRRECWNHREYEEGETCIL